jgi:hypothetical protein
MNGRFKMHQLQHTKFAGASRPFFCAGKVVHWPCTANCRCGDESNLPEPVEAQTLYPTLSMRG